MFIAPVVAILIFVALIGVVAHYVMVWRLPSPPPVWWSVVYTLGGLVAFSGPLIKWLTAGRIDHIVYPTGLLGGMVMGWVVGAVWERRHTCDRNKH